MVFRVLIPIFGIALVAASLVLSLRQLNRQKRLEIKHFERLWVRYRQAQRADRAKQREHKRSVSQYRNDLARYHNHRRH